MLKGRVSIGSKREDVSLFVKFFKYQNFAIPNEVMI